MKTRIIFFISLLISFQTIAAPVEQGKTIFASRCGNCHKLDQNFVGPALAGVHERREIDWIIKFVKSSQTMVKSGDKEALAVFEKFNKIPMPDHNDLTDDNIKSIVEYIRTESKKEASTTTTSFKPKAAKYTMLTSSSYGYFITYFAMVIGLVMALLFAVKVKEMERGKNITNI